MKKVLPDRKIAGQIDDIPAVWTGFLPVPFHLPRSAWVNLVITLMLVTANLLTDIAYVFIDPRIRLE